MKYLFLIVVFSLSYGCGAQPEFIEFSDLKIPRDNVLHVSDDSSNSVFDVSTKTIALIFPESEIEELVVGYKSFDRGSQTISLVLTQSLMNLDANSDSVINNFPINNIALEVDEYNNAYTRRYRNSENWMLLEANNGREQVVALCRKMGRLRDTDICDFKQNIANFGVTYHLRNNNISLKEGMETYIRLKIEQWRINTGAGNPSP